MKCNRQLFCHLGSFFAFYPPPPRATPPFPPPPNNPKNEDIKKMEKKAWIYHFTKVYRKS